VHYQFGYYCAGFCKLRKRKQGKNNSEEPLTATSNLKSGFVSVAEVGKNPSHARK